MNTEELIELVRNSPWLYDSSRTDFRDANKKKNTWKKIAESLGTNEQDVCRKWKCLRASFSREKRQMPSGSAGKPKQEWAFMKAMSFLHPHVKEKKMTFSNYYEETDEINLSPVCEIAEICDDTLMGGSDFPLEVNIQDITDHTLTAEAGRTEAQEVIDIQSAPATSRDEALITTKQKRKRRNDIILNSLEATDNILKKVCLEQNEDDHFCELIKYYMKALNKEKKLDLHMKILNLIKNEIKE